jgi:putative heme-binding domain-containing protein
LWDQALLTAAFGDDRRLEAALRLTDEAWAAPAVQALIEFLKVSTSPAIRERVVANLAGQYLKYPDWTGDWFGTNPLGGEFPQKTREWDQAGMRGVLSGLAIGLDDGDRGVRAQAIAGLARAGTSKEALVLLRSALLKEPDAENQAEIAATLGQREDVSAAPSLVALFSNPARPESVRMAALEATARFRDPQSLRARLELIYDSNTPEKLAARGLHDLATRGFLPINDLASFIENPSPAIRAAAILSFNVKRTLPDYLEAAVVDRIGDPAAEVRQAAIIAAAPLKLKAAIPRLLTIASDSHAPERALAIRSLCALPDPRAAAVYLAEIESTDPARRRAAEFALSEIRDQVQPALEQASKTAAFASGPGADALERVRARFEPIGDWKVIGPFPRATPPLFVGQPRIDFAQTHAGALGQTIGWRPRSPEGSDGRISLGDLAGLGFGYDAKHSPELSAFAYTEVAVETPAHALLRADSTGRIYVMVNEAPVFQAQGSPTKIPATFDSDPVRIELNRGTNRILVVSRQGVGEWGFRLQIARLDRRPILAKRPGPSAAERLAKYAMEHTGDPARGRRVFFESEAAGCARCHSASGQGKANIGPDLTGLASKYDRAELIRSVLEPSSRIATGYVPVIIATHAGAVVTGVVRRENDRVIELADSEGAIRRISRAQVAARRPATTSIMPSGLAETLRPEDFADLIAFLASLRHDRDAAAAQASATGP